jgi:membrane protein DedA with SNARE-associated domain
MIGEFDVQQLLGSYFNLTVFLGTIIFGEMIVLSAAFLLAEKPALLSNLLFFALLGTVISDTLWFLLGKKVLKNSQFWKKKEEKHKHTIDRIDNIAHGRLFRILCIIKFVYGTRILSIVYLSVRSLQLGKFTLYNSISSLMWLIVVITIGWVAGKELINLYPVFRQLEYLLGALIVLIIISKIVMVWVTKRILSEK